MRSFPLSFLALVLVGGSAAAQSATHQVIEAARRGGVVIACRHGITGSQDENEMTLVYADPTTQRRLSEEGERQSEAMGRAFRELGIKPGEVVASPMQRTRRMAELMFGMVTVDSVWHTRGDNYAAQRELRRELLSEPVPNGNRIIISHIGTLQSVLGEDVTMQEGDCAVLRPNGSSFTMVGTVPWRDWLNAVERVRR